MKGLNFDNFCGSFFIFAWFNTIAAAYWKHLLLLLFMGFIVAFLYFTQPGESIYDPPRFRFILRHLQYNELTQSKMKSQPFLDVSKPI